MTRTESTLQNILRLLPDLEELEGLRAALAGAARPDPTRQSHHFGVFPTVDSRLVDLAAVDEAVDEAERMLRERVETLFGTLRPALRAYWWGDERRAAMELIELGEWNETAGRLGDARRCFETALEISLTLADRAPRVLALRRLGRVFRGLGELKESESHYQESFQLALDTGDQAGAVIAGTGVGNVLAMAGHFAEAEESYRDALERAQALGVEGGLGLEIAQLYNNLAMATSRQERYRESESWFRKARAAWREIDSPEDLAVCLHNHALLHMRAGRTEAACLELEEAVHLDAGLSTRAAVALDLAECHARLGSGADAEQWGRRAEEFAISSRSTYVLGHVYLGLGTLARARGEANALGFLEKAVEIARRCDYALLEAETLLEYALLREARDDTAEAIACLERAREIFTQLDSTYQRDRAALEIRRLTARGSRRAPLY